MLILDAANIRKYYRDRLIVGFDDLKVYTGDRIGIVGLNGSGKTTLLNILSGEIEPDEGYVRRFCEIAYIRQFASEGADAAPKTLREFQMTGKIHRAGLSGGEKTRVKIANALSRESTMLFADEPTSNLDYQGIELLGQKLSQVDSFILISHDRNLLDNHCNRIIEVCNGKLNFYNGNYTLYKEQKEMENAQQWQEYEKYAQEKSALESAIADRKGRAKAMRKTPKRMGNSEARLHKRETTEIQQKLHSAANGMKTRLEKLERKEKPRELPRVKLDFSLTHPPENKIVISAERLSFSYGALRVFDNAGFMVYNRSKTALWGENGSGKTTLLRLISEPGCAAIYKVPKARIGYLCQEFENLHPDQTVLQNVMEDCIQTETVARTILARLLLSGDDVHKKVEVLSGGERLKVSFAKLFVSDANILLLDEPTNYLDMQSIEALENVLRDYEGTVLFVSHDKAFVNKVADRLMVIENQGIKNVTGDGSLTR